MLTRPMPPETLHQHIRLAWRRYVVPVLADRNVDGLLAALVVADTSLDDVLYAEGYTGETVCERLHQAMHSFSNFPAVLAGHQIRNRIVHHLDYHLCLEGGVAALSAYRRALWEHGVNLNVASARGHSSVAA